MQQSRNGIGCKQPDLAEPAAEPCVHLQSSMAACVSQHVCHKATVTTVTTAGTVMAYSLGINLNQPDCVYISHLAWHANWHLQS